MNKIMKQLNRESIAILGLGSENYALLKYLYSKGFKGSVTVYDMSSKAELGERYRNLKKYNNINWNFEVTSYSDLAGFSLALRSPGVFLSPAERKKMAKNRIRISCPMQLFLDLCPSKNIIGVTGTKGKGTTSTLIYSILKAAKKRTWLGGNIGVAPFEFISKVRKNDWVVLELSSFQLEDMSSSPKIGILTNLSPEHLVPADPKNPNHHVSFSAYREAKLNLFKFQKKNDIAIINKKVKSKKLKVKSEIIYFGTSTLATSLPGDHNKENIAAAAAVADVVGINKNILAKAVARFKGLPYRLEKIAVENNISYYNDSFSTTPSSTITALNAFSSPIILIAGGADKGSDFKPLAREMKRRAKAIILFKGKGSDRIKKSLAAVKASRGILKEAGNMSEALRLAHSYASPGDTILMSPACASFGMFKNYKDRGEQFNNVIKKTA